MSKFITHDDFSAVLTPHSKASATAEWHWDRAQRYQRAIIGFATQLEASQDRLLKEIIRRRIERAERMAARHLRLAQVTRSRRG